MSTLETPRTYEPITTEHLDRLSRIAATDVAQFVADHPDFADCQLATVLAQGAALHWISGTNGLKDLDVWTFFSLPTGYRRFPADIRTVHVDFGMSTLGRQQYDMSIARNERERRKFESWSRFNGRRVDLMMRGLPAPPETDPAIAIRTWLAKGRRPSDGSPWHLAQKAVVLLDPQVRRGELVWPV
jgi:hypothetical protein